MNNTARQHATGTASWTSISVSASVKRAAIRARPNDWSYASFSGEVAGSALWANLSVDCEWLDDSAGQTDAAPRLNRKKLWVVHPPHGWADAWDFARERLLGIGIHQQVWIDWYDRRVSGDGWAFTSNISEDNKILIKIANSGEDEFWGKGAAYVGTTIQGWVDEAQAQQVPAPREDDTLEFLPLEDFAEEVSIRKKADFFISYATEEEAMAREVEAALTDAGYTSVAQFKDFQKGNFVRQMREGLAQIVSPDVV
jgi:hypothetical protein